jgi:hypothetical protein
MLHFNHDTLFKFFSGSLQLLNSITFNDEHVLFHVFNHVEVFFSQKLAPELPNLR